MDSLVMITWQVFRVEKKAQRKSFRGRASWFVARPVTQSKCPASISGERATQRCTIRRPVSLFVLSFRKSPTTTLKLFMQLPPLESHSEGCTRPPRFCITTLSSRPDECRVESRPVLEWWTKLNKCNYGVYGDCVNCHEAFLLRQVKAGDVLWLIASLWCLEKNILGRFPPCSPIRRLWRALPVRTSQLLKYFSGLRSDFLLLAVAFCCWHNISKVSSSPSAELPIIRRLWSVPEESEGSLFFSFFICTTNSSIQASKPAKKLIRPSSLTEARNSSSKSLKTQFFSLSFEGKETEEIIKDVNRRQRGTRSEGKARRAVWEVSPIKQ